MSENKPSRWILWAREIQALSQTGLHYAENEYQRERYARLSEIAAEIFTESSTLNIETLSEIFMSQNGYATPRVDVRGAVFRDEKLLFVKEIIDGGWTLPGGWADVGDTPSKAVEREVFEESGFVVRAVRVLGVYDANRFNPLDLFHAFKVVFQCEILHGDAKASSETSKVSFFGEDEIPRQLSEARSPLSMIKTAFKAQKEFNWQTEFD